LTSGDDNKIMLINAETKTVERSGKVAGPKEGYKDKKSTASSMGVYTADLQSRSISHSKKHNHIAHSNNFGEIIIRDFDDFEKVICVQKQP